MERVLGLSMTSAAVRWVLVEGASGEGATINHDVLDIATVRAASSASAREVVDEVFGNAVQDPRLSAIGVTWTPEVAVEASIILESLASEGFLDAVPVWEDEAATALATGLKDLATYDNIALCIIEPDSALVVATSAHDAAVDRIDRAHSGDATGLARHLIARLDMDGWMPEIIYMVGSADDLDAVATLLRDAAGIPVISAAEAGLALARGAALASARTSGMEAWDALVPARDAYSVDFTSSGRKRGPWLTSRSGALTSVLVAAALTFVVSLSIALSLRLIPGTEAETPEQQTLAAPAARPPASEALPSVPQAPRPAPAAPPRVAESVVVAEAPVADPPEAATDVAPPVYGPLDQAPEAASPEPAGVYVPPAAEYVPPAAAPPLPGFDEPPAQPRLRDRIIERIPLINRFHEPEYPYQPPPVP